MRRRTLSILMAIVLILSMTVAAFADPGIPRPPIQSERNAPLIPYTLEDTNYCNAYNELLP